MPRDRGAGEDHFLSSRAREQVVAFDIHELQHGIDDCLHRESMSSAWTRALWYSNWRREASMKLAAGDVVGALKDFEDRRLLQFAQDRDQGFRQIAREWSELTCSGKSVAVLAYTRADVAHLNKALRSTRRAAGEITGADTEIRTGSKKSDRIQVAIGDRLMTGENDNYKGVLNSAIGTVEAIREIPGSKGKARHEIDLRMESGELRTIDTQTYIKKDGSAHLGYADAMTTFNAQGVMRDAALLYGTENLNQRVAYVACTRARGSTKIILNADSIEEAYVNDQRNAERSPPTLQDLRAYIDHCWSRRPEKALALDHISEANARKLVSEWQTRVADRQGSAAAKMALEVQLPQVAQIEPLLTASEMEEVVTQRERMDRQISHGRSDKHVVIAYSQGDAIAVRIAYGDHVTLVKARREQGLIGHSQALDAVRNAALITIVHQPDSSEEERARIEGQARRLADDGNAGKLENFRPELKAGKSFERVVIEEQGKRMAMREQERVQQVRIEQQCAKAEEGFPRHRRFDDSRGATPLVSRGDTARGTVDEDASLNWEGPRL